MLVDFPTSFIGYGHLLSVRFAVASQSLLQYSNNRSSDNNEHDWYVFGEIGVE